MTPLGSKRITLLTQTIATDSTTSAVVDRLGFNYAVFDITMRPATATNSSAKWGVLKLGDSDTTAVSDASDITGYIGTTNATAATTVTAAEFVIAAQNTTVAGGGTAQNGGGQVTRLMLPLHGRKRYLFLTIQGGASHQTAFVTCDLFRAAQTPVATGTASANVAVLVGA